MRHILRKILGYTLVGIGSPSILCLALFGQAHSHDKVSLPEVLVSLALFGVGMPFLPFMVAGLRLVAPPMDMNIGYAPTEGKTRFPRKR